MSCDRRQRQLSLAGLRCGLTAAQGRIRYGAGRLAASLTRTAARPVTGVLRIVESFDGPGSFDALGPAVVGLEAAAWLSAGGRRRSVQTEPVPAWLNQGVEASNSRRWEYGIIITKFW